MGFFPPLEKSVQVVVGGKRGANLTYNGPIDSPTYVTL